MIVSLYISMMPVIFGGIFNMLFVKIKKLSFLRIPIDCRMSLGGKRIFGDSKTLLGFVGMMIGTSIFSIIWGFVLKISDLESFNLIYKYHGNTLIFNMFTGILFGFAYMIFELPNSFIKRRFDIDASHRGRFPVNIFVFIYDQTDSMLGVISVLAILGRLTLPEYIFGVFLGGITHIVVNLVLIMFGVRRYL